MPASVHGATSSRLAAFAEERAGLLLALFSIGYLALMIHFAPRRTMWIDEYLTYYLARLPMAEIRKALLTGAESHPPSFLVLTGASMKLVGVGPLGLRLPAIAGILLMHLCVFQFVARRTSRLVAFTAMLVPFTTRATSYALEGRGYGLLLGMAALALVCWQSACDGRRKGLAAAALGASLAAATACHYLGALIVLPLAAGEAVRTLATRRIAWPIWAAFLAPLIPLAFFAPMIRASGSYAAQHGLLNADFDYYSFLLRDGHALLLALLAALALSGIRRRGGAVSTVRPAGEGLQMHEAAAIAGYLLLPVAAWVAARAFHAPFSDRYVLSAAIAVSVLVAWAMDAMPGRDDVAALVLAGLAVWAGGSYILRAKNTGPTAPPEGAFVMSHGQPDLPIAVADIDTLSRLRDAAPEQLAQRLVYLTDRKLSIRYLGHDTADRIMEDLRPWLPFHSEPFCDFVSATPEFEVYGAAGGFMNWLTRALAEDGVTMQVLGIHGDQLLLLARPTTPGPLCGGRPGASAFPVR